MSSVFPRRIFSRRDILKVFAGHMKQDATPASQTGIDPLSRSIDQHIEIGDYDQAVEKLKALLQKSPDHIQAHRKLGFCLLQIGHTVEAEKVFAGILRHLPHDSFALLHQGLNLAQQNRLTEAIDLWRQYLNTDQPIIQRAVNLQIALHETGAPADPQEVADQILTAIATQQTMDHE
jgi:Flp pilus assembly protein TadD